MSNWFKTYGFADIQDDLLVGAYPLDQGDVDMLRWLRIERILNLVEDQEYESGEREELEDALFEASIEERRMSLTDYGRLPAPELERAVGQVVDWLEQGRRVYLHCRAGRQRSAAVAAGVVALREGVGIEEALALVNKRKPSADPLPQQRADLFEWWAERDVARQGGETGDAVQPDEAARRDGVADRDEVADWGDAADRDDAGDRDEVADWGDAAQPGEAQRDDAADWDDLADWGDAAQPDEAAQPDDAAQPDEAITDGAYVAGDELAATGEIAESADSAGETGAGNGAETAAETGAGTSAGTAGVRGEGTGGEIAAGSGETEETAETGVGTADGDASSGSGLIEEADDIEDLLAWLAELDPARREQGAGDGS